MGPASQSSGTLSSDAPRFWLELEVIAGEHDGDYHYAGSWVCAPILLDDPGFQDLDIDAPGSWTLQPAVP